LQFYFGVDGDACEFNATCSRRDLPFCLQLLTAYLTDAAYHGETMTQARASFGSMYTSLANSAGGPINLVAERLLAGGDRRFGVPEPNDLLSRDLPELSGWLEPQFQHGPMEVAVVGDVPWTEAAEHVARTFGTLGPRDPRPPSRSVPAPKPAIQPGRGLVLAGSPTVKQSALAWMFPVPDSADIHLERRCHLLAAIVAERFRVRLREGFGASYAQSASLVLHPGMPQLNYFWCYAEVAPPDLGPAAQLLSRELAALWNSGPDEDEFVRAKEPMLRGREAEFRSNAYWLRTVLRDIQQNPNRLVAARDRAADFASITRAELVPLARRYLDPAQALIFAAQPAAAKK